MYYAPHKIEKRYAPKVVTDEFGRPSIPSTKEVWREVCEGRCDKSSEDDKSSDNGHDKASNYKIVIGCRGRISFDDVVRVKDKKSGTVICQGVVKRVKENNFLDYSELWVSM